MDLSTFFKEQGKVALAFSGGVDSSYLLYAALQNGADITAYYAKTAFQPQFELDDALRLAKELGARMRVLELDVLEDENVRANPENRCYYCKHRLFSALIEAAKADGYSVLIDGNNFSDDANDRAGMRAVQELKVLSPLRLCGITKKEVRRLSKEAGLFTWDKPAYACLATRIPSGVPITKEDLARTERAEDILFSMGFSDFRVRLFGGAARLQLPKEHMQEAFARMDQINDQLKELYPAVLLDLNAR